MNADFERCNFDFEIFLLENLLGFENCVIDFVHEVNYAFNIHLDLFIFL